MIALSDVTTFGTPNPNPVFCSVKLSGTANTGSASGPRARLENHLFVGGTRPCARRSAWSGFGVCWTTFAALVWRVAGSITAVAASPPPSTFEPAPAASPLVLELVVQAVTVASAATVRTARPARSGPARPRWVASRRPTPVREWRVRIT